MKNSRLHLTTLTLLGGLALSTGAIATLDETSAATPFPLEYCIPQGASPVALGVSLAYGLALGERRRNDEMSQDDFRQALMSFQSVTQLMLVDQDPEAACQLLANLEEQYDLPRPDLNALPGTPVQPYSSEEDQ